MARFSRIEAGNAANTPFGEGGPIGGSKATSLPVTSCPMATNKPASGPMPVPETATTWMRMGEPYRLRLVVAKCVRSRDSVGARELTTHIGYPLGSERNEPIGRMLPKGRVH